MEKNIFKSFSSSRVLRFLFFPFPVSLMLAAERELAITAYTFSPNSETAPRKEF